MNNLHRELAPISDAAWAQIEEEASRTLKRYLAGRRVVDLQGPSGVGLSAVGTGHLQNIAAPGDGQIIFVGMNNQTADSIKSLEGYQRAWVEEAQNFSQRSLDLLRPTIRTAG